ncbi:FUSC family protein [Pseudonocardia sp. DR1-2]|uniref:FUSC family protein n=1 Tax=Pseudonocardia sp. DR1-2 TaxID=2951168 RepID=UPI002043A36B|nr:FUSC family protein [Pseudonocardia sp. DR1-2]MCM3849015.1 FUSC family protein [Pseudonocardia sp. DR1-2]
MQRTVPTASDRLLRARDRFVASDPGLVRLVSAVRAVLAIASTLGVEYLVATTTGTPPLVPMMLGAVVAMLASFGIFDATRAGQAVTLCFLALSMLAGMSVALLVDRNRLASLTAFVVVVFVAVWVRRFGLRYFVCGMGGFMGYFFALFLSLRPEMLPGVAFVVAVAIVWVMLLTLVLLPIRNDRVLRRMLRSFEARLAGLAGTVLALDGHAPGTAERERAEARLASLLVRVNEAALVIDGQLGTPAAVADDDAARIVRRAVFDAELAVTALTRVGPGALDCDDARAVLTALHGGRWDAVRERAGRVADRVAAPGPRRLAVDATVLADARADWTAALDTAPEGGPATVGEAAAFAPAVQLFAGNLPGSAGTVTRLHRPPDPGRPASRLSLTTRQAVQVAVATAVAIAVGDALSEQRYYWAVLAAFIAFTGTATVAETVRKAAHRIVGTMIGLVGAIALVPVLGPDVAVVLPVILLSIFGALYLFRLSYALMIFFITLMLGELYALLGTFTVDLMVLRLEETVVGGLIGCAVSVLVLPTRTRSAAEEARRGLLDALAELLGTVDRALRRPGPCEDLRAGARALDAALHQTLLLGRPLTRTWLGSTHRDVVHGLTACTAVAEHARRLARSAEGVSGTPALTAGCARLAQLTADAVAGRPVPAGSCAAVLDLLIGPAGGTGRGAALAREAGLLAAELPALLETGDDGPAPATVGRVRGPDGAPAAATVTVVDGAGRQLDRVTTGDDGGFAVRVPAGTHLLVVAPAVAGPAPFGEHVHVGPGTVLPDVVLAAPLARPVPLPVPAGVGAPLRGPARAVGRACVRHA